MKLNYTRAITSDEDKIIRRWTQACGELNECHLCPYEKACQRLGDKLINRLKKIRQARRG